MFFEHRGERGLHDRRNLVHDTLFGRSRARLTRTLHDIDYAVMRLRSGDRRRILFEAASPLSLAVFGPVYERLRRDERIELWLTTADTFWTAERIFSGVAGRVATQRESKWTKFDVYINADFTNMTWLPRRTRRVHLFHGVAGKCGLDAPTKIAPVVAAFDRLMFPNADRLKRYAQLGLVDPDSPQAVLAGYPKVDCLVDGSLDDQAVKASLALDSARPTVLYAPTWSPYSSLSTMGEEVIAALSRLDVNVLVKLHDRSYDLSPRASGGIAWRRRLDALARRWPVHVFQDADVSRCLAAADVLVTDHSSVGFEFMLLDRPIIVIDCPALLENASVAPDKAALLRSASEVIRRPDELAPAISRALRAPGQRGDQRRAIAADLFYRPGAAAARVTAYVYDLLELPEPGAERLTDAEPDCVPVFRTRKGGPSSCAL